MSSLSSVIEITKEAERDSIKLDGDRLMLPDGTVIKFASVEIAIKLAAAIMPDSGDMIERAIWLVSRHPEITPALLRAAHKIDPGDLSDPTSLVYGGAVDLSNGRSADWSTMAGTATTLLVNALKALL